MIPPATSVLVAMLRRVFVCRTGHAFMWRRGPGGDWLECSRCLTVRVIAPPIGRVHVA